MISNFKLFVWLIRSDFIQIWLFIKVVATLIFNITATIPIGVSSSKFTGRQFPFMPSYCNQASSFTMPSWSRELFGMVEKELCLRPEVNTNGLRLCTSSIISLASSSLLRDLWRVYSGAVWHCLSKLFPPSRWEHMNRIRRNGQLQHSCIAIKLKYYIKKILLWHLYKQ